MNYIFSFAHVVIAVRFLTSVTEIYMGWIIVESDIITNRFSKPSNRPCSRYSSIDIDFCYVVVKITYGYSFYKESDQRIHKSP